MNKFAKKMAKREGFTLVELIVVIAILAILAGIAIPVYSGYIKKANEAALYQELDSVKTAATFAWTEDKVDVNPFPEVTTIVVTANDVTVNGTSYKTDADFLALVGQTTTFTFDFSKVDATTATWNKTAPTGGQAGWTLSK